MTTDSPSSFDAKDKAAGNLLHQPPEQRLDNLVAFDAHSRAHPPEGGPMGRAAMMQALAYASQFLAGDPRMQTVAERLRAMFQMLKDLDDGKVAEALKPAPRAAGAPGTPTDQARARAVIAACADHLKGLGLRDQRANERVAAGCGKKPSEVKDWRKRARRGRDGTVDRGVYIDVLKMLRDRDATPEHVDLFLTWESVHAA